MARRSIFWTFVKDETLKNMKGSDFIGFLGIMVLIFPFSFVNSDQSENPMKDQTGTIAILVGMMCGFFFVYLISQTFTKEFEKRTINILVTTPLGRSKIFIGKALSNALLIPITLGVIGLSLAIVYSASGTMTTIQIEFALYFLLLLAQFLLSVISFSMLISIWLKKTGSMLTIMALYIFLFLFLGAAVGMSWGPNGPIINYPINVIFSSSLYLVGILVFESVLTPNWYLLSIQFIYMMACFVTGIVLFRRAQIWG